MADLCPVMRLDGGTMFLCDSPRTRASTRRHHPRRPIGGELDAGFAFAGQLMAGCKHKLELTMDSAYSTADKHEKSA